MMKDHRTDFKIDEEICYLNTAYMAPRLKRVHDAAINGVQTSSKPWRITSEDFFTSVEQARDLFSHLVGASANNIALVPSASYGIETAAKNLKLKQSEAILTLERQFPSNIYPWHRLARERGAQIITVKTPGDGDWTSAILDHMSDQIAIAALPHCHWTNGAMLDLSAISGACHAHGTALVLDVTQSLGAVPLNLQAIAPDFLICASYKWLLGPYSLGFLYVADQHLDGEPMEENWINRIGSEDFSQLVHYRDSYQAGARRFDFGERNNPILVPMAIAALSQLQDWGVDYIAEQLTLKTRYIQQKAAQYGYHSTAPASAAPHMLGLTTDEGLPPDLQRRLLDENIHVSVRGHNIRVAPHLHITEADINRFLSALAR